MIAHLRKRSLSDRESRRLCICLRSLDASSEQLRNHHLICASHHNLAASAKKCFFGKLSDTFCGPARAFTPHCPKKRCVRRASKTPSMTSPVTASHAVTPIGGVSGVTHTEQTRPCHAVMLARHDCSKDPCGWEDLPRRTFTTFPSGEVVRVPGQGADACSSCPVWGDDDAPL
jgi:hypothetical protein